MASLGIAAMLPVKVPADKKVERDFNELCALVDRHMTTAADFRPCHDSLTADAATLGALMMDWLDMPRDIRPDSPPLLFTNGDVRLLYYGKNARRLQEVLCFASIMVRLLSTEDAILGHTVKRPDLPPPHHIVIVECNRQRVLLDTHELTAAGHASMRSAFLALRPSGLTVAAPVAKGHSRSCIVTRNDEMLKLLCHEMLHLYRLDHPAWDETQATVAPNEGLVEYLATLLHAAYVTAVLDKKHLRPDALMAERAYAAHVCARFMLLSSTYSNPDSLHAYEGYYRTRAHLMGIPDKVLRALQEEQAKGPRVTMTLEQALGQDPHPLSILNFTALDLDLGDR